MTLDEFVAKYNGQKVDFDGSFGAQCVDLYRQYCQDVLNIPQTPPVVGAYQIFDTAPDAFEKIKNTPLGLPQKGDIMIWAQSYGGYGHVGIVTQATLSSFTAFEQNDPLGSPCTLKNYSYKAVTGWIRLKPQLPPQQVVEIKKVAQELIIKIT